MWNVGTCRPDAVSGGEKLTRVGNMKLTHPTKWFRHIGGPMLKLEGRMELTVLRRHGASIRELARVTGHSRNMVRRYLRRRGGRGTQTGDEAS